MNRRELVTGAAFSKEGTRTMDCVRMKEEIQRRLAEEFAGLSAEEMRKERIRRIESNPIFGDLVKQWGIVNPEGRNE